MYAVGAGLSSFFAVFLHHLFKQKGGRRRCVGNGIGRWEAYGDYENGSSYGRNQHYNESRYHMTNYHAVFTKGTIEFRLFNFDKPANGKKNGLHAGQLKSWIQLCLALSEMAKEVRTASPKPQQTENPKFAMRTWLIRLGLVG